MYLSRIELDTNRHNTRRAISSPQKIHAAIEQCFRNQNLENVPRKLWRIDSLNDKLYLLLLSPELPDFTHFAKQFSKADAVGETKNYEPLINRIKNGQQLHFRLCGNPVHSVRKAEEKGTRGKVFPHITIEQKRNWLIKKAESNGFCLEDGAFDVVETGIRKFYRKPKELQGKGESTVEIAYSVFEGVLTVIDVEKFTHALTQGVGRAKAYGCGLLTVIGTL